MFAFARIPFAIGVGVGPVPGAVGVGVFEQFEVKWLNRAESGAGPIDRNIKEKIFIAAASDIHRPLPDASEVDIAIRTDHPPGVRDRGRAGAEHRYAAVLHKFDRVSAEAQAVGLDTDTDEVFIRAVGEWPVGVQADDIPSCQTDGVSLAISVVVVVAQPVIGDAAGRDRAAIAQASGIRRGRKRRRFDRPGAMFECPVTVGRRVACRVRRGLHVGLGQFAQPADELHTGLAIGDIAAIEQDVGPG